MFLNIISMSLVMAVGSDVPVVESGLAKEIRLIRKKVTKTKETIKDLKKSLQVMVDVKADIQRDLVVAERGFSDKFAQILGPLLAWPKVSMNSRVTTWSEREHGQLVLDHTREALIKESILMVAERDLELKRATQIQGNYETQLRELGQRQRVLSLQLEELKLLQRRQVSTRR